MIILCYVHVRGNIKSHSRWEADIPRVKDTSVLYNIVSSERICYSWESRNARPDPAASANYHRQMSARCKNADTAAQKLILIHLGPFYTCITHSKFNGYGFGDPFCSGKENIEIENKKYSIQHIRIYDLIFSTYAQRMPYQQQQQQNKSNDWCEYA